MANMTNILQKILKKKTNQLEESYRFNIKDYSFTYNERKAFIKNIGKSPQLINPFLHYRKELDSFVTSYGLEHLGTFEGAEQFHKYLHKCMAIIANMLDHTKMGSVEHYLDHIWNEFDIALNDKESMEPMQKFVNNISNIITMIDYAVETQLADIDKDGQSILIQSAVNKIDPDLKVTKVTPISDTIIKVEAEKSNQEISNSIDLKNIKPLNTKEI